jgi:two-component system, OmpR family, sensor kinase
MNRFRPPLGLQLTLGFALVAVLALGGGGLLLARAVVSNQVAARSSRGLEQARLVASLATEHRFAQAPQDLPLALFSFHQQSGARPVIVGSDGTVVADSWIPSPLLGQPLAQPEVRQALTGAEATGHGSVAGEGWLLYAAVPIHRAGRLDGAVLLSVDMNDLGANLQQMRSQLLWTLALAGLVAVGAGMALARYLAAPLERLTHATTAMGGGDLATQVAVGGSREVSELGDRFNAMAAQLRRLDEQRRHFVAAASHELRTPVAAIRALADALLSDTSGNIALYKEYLHDVVRESDRARQLMNRLLELARLEARAPGAETEVQEIDLREVCLDVVESLEPLATERQVALAVTAGEPAPVRTDPWLVQTVLTNLAQNALKYTPAGGQVAISIVPGDGAVRLPVADTGPGIPAEHIPHLFDRFYRVEKSRSRGTGGVGLGLAIAAEAARVLQGRIEVESEAGKGSCFTLVIPSMHKN